MKFRVDKKNGVNNEPGVIVLYQVENNVGMIFYRRNLDNTVDVYPEFEHINNEYTKNIVDKLDEENVYELDDLIKQNMNKENLRKLSRYDLEEILTEVYKKLDSSAKDNYYNKIHADYYPEIIKGKFKTMVNFVDVLITSKQRIPEPIGKPYYFDFKYPDKISLGTFLKNKYNMLCSIECDVHLSEELWSDIIDNIDFKKFVENINEYETLDIYLCNYNSYETGRNWKVLIKLNFSRKLTDEENKRHTGAFSIGIVYNDYIENKDIIERFEKENQPEKEIITLNGKKYKEI